MVNAGPTTISRSHKLRQTRLRKELTEALVFSLRNDFTGTSVPIEFVWAEYDTDHGILRYSDGGPRGPRYHIDVHSNLWYELK